MYTKLPVTHLKASTFGFNNLISSNKDVSKFGYFSINSASQHKLRFKLVGAHGDRWKHTNAVQERINSWLSKTQHFLTEVTSPLVKAGHSGKPDPGNEVDTQDMDDIFLGEQTVSSRMPNGNLSFAAIVSIEQFSRMNGLTGQKMQMTFKALVPKPVYDDARNLVEYCCFRFLSKDASDFHPSLKEPAFQRLIFITMLAWENPYSDKNDLRAHASRKASFQGKLVGEEAFTRIAPAIPGVADHPTVHNLFKALAGDEKGISLRVWLTYIDELLRVHEGRRSYHSHEYPQLSEERILCIGSGKKRPVLKWENNMAWPGKLTLTDKALYFEVPPSFLTLFKVLRSSSFAFQFSVQLEKEKKIDAIGEKAMKNLGSVMASSKVIPTTSQANTDLPRQSSLCSSLSTLLADLQNQPNQSQNGLGSMNMDDFLKNICSSPPPSNPDENPQFAGGDGFSLPKDVTNKSVDDVWKQIVVGGDDQRQGDRPPERMTLEDFLTKAGAVREEDVRGVVNQVGVGAGVYAVDQGVIDGGGSQFSAFGNKRR
ncbi:hypothetical protein GQ457_10G021970 [Hibiscus cannabinus]